MSVTLERRQKATVTRNAIFIYCGYQMEIFIRICNNCYFYINSSFSYSSSIGTTAHCGLWPVEQCPSTFSYLPPTLSIFSLPALEDLFLLPLSILSWVFPFSSLPVLSRKLGTLTFWNPLGTSGL